MARELAADLLLIDEAAGRTVARRLGLEVSGIVGLLLEAKRWRELAYVPPCWGACDNPASGYRIGFFRRLWIGPASEDRENNLSLSNLSIKPLPPHRSAGCLGFFHRPGPGGGDRQGLEAALKEPGVEDVTAKYRGGDRLVKLERCDYVRPTIVHCSSSDAAMVKKESPSRRWSSARRIRCSPR